MFSHWRIKGLLQIHKAILAGMLALQLTPAIANAELALLTSHEPPMNFERHGKVEGVITDYVKLLASHTQHQQEIEIAPWARVLELGLQRPNTLIFSAERNPQRERSFYWIGPVMAKHWYFITREDSDKKYHQLEQYKQLEYIGVLRADNRETWLKAQGFTNLYPLNTLEQAYKMLLAKRIDAVLTGDIEHAYMLAQQPAFQQLVKVHYVNTAYSYLALSKSTPADIAKQWQEAFQHYKESQELIEIQHKWQQKLTRDLTLHEGMFELSKAKH
ncbi:substrate-binding periplasmic protein [Motilimonas sp. KMU-193]|uniref:substrate-binding periplasmic protein n=1 Tax=Motilimonas sp. KMU-193 TaxID=3388668 RepID=UPI00396B0E7B